jgi:hypothetical protein
MMHTRIEYPKIEDGVEKSRQKKTKRLKKKADLSPESSESTENLSSEKAASGS